jgi:hypothetical protein
MRGLSYVFALALCAIGTTPLIAQDAVPTEMLERTLLIRGKHEQGTAFLIDHKGKTYLVTARHLTTGLPREHPTIQIREKGEWKTVSLVKLIFPESNDVDIAVFVTGDDAPKPFSITSEKSSHGITLGQQVWFLGYPFLEGLESEGSNFEAPFIKRGTASAVVSTNPKAVIFYIDGFNNKGFSGGPILYWSFPDHVYRILGVVQGYKNDQAEAVVNGRKFDTNILVNSGILIAYGIDNAIDAIDKDLEQK